MFDFYHMVKFTLGLCVESVDHCFIGMYCML